MPNQNILILEDNLEFAETLTELLQSNGYTVKCYDNVSDAYSAFKTEKIDLVISDIHVKIKKPGTSGSGLDFIKKIRKRSDVPVIVTTGMDLVSEESVLRRGVDHFMYKSGNFDFLDLIAKVKTLCQDIPD